MSNTPEFEPLSWTEADFLWRVWLEVTRKPTVRFTSEEVARSGLILWRVIEKAKNIRMSDTPETDAACVHGTGNDYGIVRIEPSFARKLERERDEARQEATDYRNADAEAHRVEPTPLPWEKK